MIVDLLILIGAITFYAWNMFVRFALKRISNNDVLLIISATCGFIAFVQTIICLVHLPANELSWPSIWIVGFTGIVWIEGEKQLQQRAKGGR